MRKFEGEPTPETTKHVTQVNGENVLEGSSTKAGTPHFTRRNFLKAMIVGGGAAAASYAMGKSGLTLRQESDTAEKNKPEYDFIPLVEDLKPVEVVKLNEELKVLNDALTGKLVEDLKPENMEYSRSVFGVCTSAVKHLRNAYAAGHINSEQLMKWYSFISKNAVTDVDWGEPEYSLGKEEKYTTKILNNSLKVAIRFEAFKSARYFALKEPRWKESTDILNPLGSWTVALHPADLRDGDPRYRHLVPGSDGGWDDILRRGDGTVANADPERGSVEYTTSLVKNNWRYIKAASGMYGIDPFYIAAIISMESTDVKLYKLFGAHAEGNFFQDETYKKDPRALLSRALWEGSGIGERSGLKGALIKGLLLVWQQEKYLKRIIGDLTITEDTIDLLGALAGDDVSVGLGQVNLSTARKYGLVNVGRITTTEEVPDQVLGFLLTNPAINIGAIAAYTRALVDKYETMQEEGLNLRLPDLSKYSPTVKNSGNLLEGDPEFSPHFGIRFYGGMYTTVEYPSGGLSHYNIWGGPLTSFYLYYKHEAESLGLT